MMKKGAAGVQLHFAINSKKTIKNIANAHASSSLQHQFLANWNFGEIRITYRAYVLGEGMEEEEMAKVKA